MNNLWQDLRYGIRMLLKQKAFTFIAVLTLALGIGANTAIFSVVNSVLIEPLPYKDADRLVMIWETLPSAGIEFNTPAPANFYDWREQSNSFESLAALTTQISNLTGAGEPEQIRGLRVSANMFSLLGVQPRAGRAFTEEEDRPGDNRVVIISHSLWQRRFAGDDEIIGKTISLGNANHTVVGVMPVDFQFPDVITTYDPEFWTPLALAPEDARSMSRMLWIIGRLRGEVSDRQAQAEIEGIVERFQERNSMQRGSFGVNIVPLEDQLRGNLRPALLVLLAAAGFVLLIACANVANLLLTRAVARQKELAIRLALGAGQWRLMKQFLTESILISIFGGIAGLLMAVWGVSLLELVLPPSLSVARDTTIDARVFLFTMLVSIATGVVCGVAPSLQSRRSNLNLILKEGGRDSSAGRRSGLRNILVVTEIAMAVVLLVGAGLMISSFIRLNRIDMGFQADSLLTMNLSLPSAKYDTDQKRTAFYDQLIPRLAALPGVESVAAINGLPVSFRGGGSTFEIEGRAEPNNFTALSTYRIINADYFKTMRIPLIAGRAFTDQDTRDVEFVAIISESLARITWPGEDPLGKRIRWGSEGEWMKIAGIVGDIKLSQIAETSPHVYMPYTQAPRHPYEVALKTKVDPLSLAAAMRKEVWAVDKDLPVADVRTMEQLLASAISRPRFNMLLLALFASIALVLAVIGIYGVMSYAVTQSTREIGIRMALGAQQRDVLKLVIGQGLLLTVAGLGLGVAGAFALTRLMASLLYGVSATDPLTFIIVSALLVAVALLACYLPARRASKVDPMVALRYE